MVEARLNCSRMGIKQRSHHSLIGTLRVGLEFFEVGPFLVYITSITFTTLV